jgi:PRC-barrel domain
VADDHGAPIAYAVLAEGTPVRSSDGAEVGTVKRVLADEGADVFDGIVVDTDEGERFVDAPVVADLYERLVVLTIGAEQARGLPEPSAGPAVVDVSADDVAGDTRGDRVKDAAKRTWDRLSGNY